MTSEYELKPTLSDDERESIYGKELDPLVAQLFYNRGITSKKEVAAFYEFEYAHLHDPFLYKDMEKGVERILHAIEKKEKILIYSDYDTDGIPGGALLYTFFTKIGYENFQNYIPNRNKDGYSLNMPVCEKFVEDSVDVLITVDCGITDKEEIKYLMENNIDVIVTDHHLPEGGVPAAYAVIDHKQADCNYPDTNLCGCGVAWKLVVALLQRARDIHSEDETKYVWIKEVSEGWEKTLLDLVAISTICDMVPLVGENRLLVNFGTKMLDLSARDGLHTIYKNAKLTKPTLPDDVAFMIGPRINAASRLDDPMIAFNALAKSGAEAIASANMLETLNNKRKTLSATIMRGVWKKLDERDSLETLGEVIVIGDSGWPLGILGLVAGKIADRYKRPTFVWSELDEKIKGSCRSGSDIDVFSLMQESREHFVSFGGHAASGGFVMSKDELHYLEQNLSKNIISSKKIDNPVQYLDAHVQGSEVTHELYEKISQLEPFGMGNAKPLFKISLDNTAVRTFGKSQNHLEVSGSGPQGKIRATAFYCQPLIDKARDRDSFLIVGNIVKDSYNGNTSIAIRIVDII